MLDTGFGTLFSLLNQHENQMKFHVTSTMLTCWLLYRDISPEEVVTA